MRPGISFSAIIRDLRAENLKLQKTNRALNQALRSLNAKNEAKVGASMEPKHPGECTDAELAAGCRYYKKHGDGCGCPIAKEKAVGWHAGMNYYYADVGQNQASAKEKAA